MHIELKKLLETKAVQIFEHITVEIHIWKLIYDANGEIETWSLIYANPAALKAWQVSSLDSIEGKTTDQIFGDESTTHYLPIVRKVFAELSLHTYEDYFPNLNKHFRFTTVPMGEYFVTTGEDITDLILKQHSIEKANQGLEESADKRYQELQQAVEHMNQALFESHKLREQLSKQANCDPLTGLFNRRYLDKYFKHEIYRANRYDFKVSCIYFDVDNFKGINDSLGHDAGDAVLQKVAEVLSQTFREADVACRYGGDEFVIILPETDLQQSQSKAEAMKNALYNANHPGLFDSGVISISAGIAEYPTHGDTTQQILKAADNFLLLAKKQGKNRIVSTNS